MSQKFDFVSRGREWIDAAKGPVIASAILPGELVADGRGQIRAFALNYLE